MHGIKDPSPHEVCWARQRPSKTLKITFPLQCVKTHKKRESNSVAPLELRREMRLSRFNGIPRCGTCQVYQPSLQKDTRLCTDTNEREDSSFRSLCRVLIFRSPVSSDYTPFCNYVESASLVSETVEISTFGVPKNLFQRKRKGWAGKVLPKAYFAKYLHKSCARHVSKTNSSLLHTDLR